MVASVDVINELRTRQTFSLTHTNPFACIKHTAITAHFYKQILGL